LPAAEVTAVDVSQTTMAVAARNADAAGVAPRVRVVVSDWTAALGPDERFDLVVANPPYIPSDALADLPPEVRREPRLALDGGPDGLESHRRVVAAAAHVAAPGAALVSEVGAGQAPAVAALFTATGFDAVGTHADLAGIARVVAGKARGVSS
jgi:release factor glutamine methyltransferase